MDIELGLDENGKCFADVFSDVLSPMRCSFENETNAFCWKFINSDVSLDGPMPKCSKRVEKLLERYAELFGK